MKTLYFVFIAFSLYANFATKAADIDWNYVVPKYGNVTVFQKFTCLESRLQNLFWLKYRNFHTCVHIVTDMTIPSCLYEQLERNGLTYMSKNISFLETELEHRQLRGTKCGTFMIITQDPKFIKELFDSEKPHFRPFTNIFLFIPKWLFVPRKYILRTINRGYNVFALRNSFFNTSTPYFNLNYWYLKNLQTNQTMFTREPNKKLLTNFFGTVEGHPLFNKSITKGRPFRVALFHCPPYVIIKNSKENK